MTAAIGAVVVCQSFSLCPSEALFALQLKAPQISFSFGRHRSDDFKPVSTEKKFPEVAAYHFWYGPATIVQKSF